MNIKDLYPTDELIGEAINIAYPSNCKYKPTPADYLIAKFAVDNAVRKIVGDMKRKNKYPQCKGLVLTVEDWQALEELIK